MTECKNASCDAGNEIVVEEFLEGEEVSFFALIDGETCIPLASAQVQASRLIPPAVLPHLPLLVPHTKVYSWPHNVWATSRE